MHFQPEVKSVAYLMRFSILLRYERNLLISVSMCVCVCARVCVCVRVFVCVCVTLLSVLHRESWVSY